MIQTPPSQMMDFAERLEALPQLEGAILWSMRAWAIGLSRGIPVADEIHALYLDLDAPAASNCLEDFMQALNQGATRMLEVNCVCHPKVSVDELDLLDVLALHQENRARDAVTLLERMMMPEHALLASQAASRLIAYLNLAGHDMPRASDSLRRHAFRAEMIWTTVTASQCMH